MRCSGSRNLLTEAISDHSRSCRKGALLNWDVSMSIVSILATPVGASVFSFIIIFAHYIFNAILGCIVSFCNDHSTKIEKENTRAASVSIDISLASLLVMLLCSLKVIPSIISQNNIYIYTSLCFLLYIGAVLLGCHQAYCFRLGNKMELYLGHTRHAAISLLLTINSCVVMIIIIS